MHAYLITCWIFTSAVIYEAHVTVSKVNALQSDHWWFVANVCAIPAAGMLNCACHLHVLRYGRGDEMMVVEIEASSGGLFAVKNCTCLAKQGPCRTYHLIHNTDRTPARIQHNRSVVSVRPVVPIQQCVDWLNAWATCGCQDKFVLMESISLTYLANTV